MQWNRFIGMTNFLFWDPLWIILNANSCMTLKTFHYTPATIINIISTDFPSEFFGTIQENLVTYSVSCFSSVLLALTSHPTSVSWSVQFTSTCQMFLSSCYWLGILWGLSDTPMTKHLYLKIQTYLKKDILQAIPVSFNPLSPLFCHKLFFWRSSKQSSLILSQVLVSTAYMPDLLLARWNWNC